MQLPSLSYSHNICNEALVSVVKTTNLFCSVIQGSFQSIPPLFLHTANNAMGCGSLIVHKHFFTIGRKC